MWEGWSEAEGPKDNTAYGAPITGAPITGAPISEAPITDSSTTDNHKQP